MSTVKQISVFAQNEPGKIKRIAEILSQHNLNIRAITIASGDNYGIIKLLVDNPRSAHQALKNEGLSVALNEVLAVEMEDRPGGLHKLLELLAEHHINIEDAYGFVIESSKRAVLVINVTDAERANKVLSTANIELLQEKDLYQL